MDDVTSRQRSVGSRVSDVAESLRPRGLLAALAVVAALVISAPPAFGLDLSRLREESLASPGLGAAENTVDDKLVAAGRGWTPDEATSQRHAAEAIGGIAEKLFKHNPDLFVGSMMSEKPGGAPTLYVKGPADKFVRDLIAASSIEVILADNQPYSFDELEERKLRVHHALEARGFQNVVSGINIAGAGLIPATVASEPGLPATSAEILPALPADLRSDVRLTISDPSGFRDTNASFGGMLVTKDGGNWATSGWTVGKVIGSVFVTGVTTAGHASGTNGIVHP